MQINGRWAVGVDGVERPVFDGALLLPTRQLVAVQCVLDTGADLTLLPYDLAQALNAYALPQPGPTVSGAGGTAATLLLDVTLVFTTTDGHQVGLRGPVPALATLSALDFPVLGRNLINLFGLAYDRSRDLLALIMPPSQVKILL